jgi:hypothetical protein
MLLKCAFKLSKVDVKARRASPSNPIMRIKMGSAARSSTLHYKGDVHDDRGKGDLRCSIVC